MLKKEGPMDTDMALQKHEHGSKHRRLADCWPLLVDFLSFLSDAQNAEILKPLRRVKKSEKSIFDHFQKFVNTVLGAQKSSETLHSKPETQYFLTGNLFPCTLGGDPVIKGIFLEGK